MNMPKVNHKSHISAATTGMLGGDVRAFRRAAHVGKKPELSEQTRRTFEAISAPVNARHFTKSAALRAFAHVEI